MTGVLERCRAIDEKHCIVDAVFLAEFSEERVSENEGSRRFKRYLK